MVITTRGFAPQSILPRQIEKGCVQSVRVQGPPGGTLQTMIGEMAFSTAQENGKRSRGVIPPEEQSHQSQESQAFANPYFPYSLYYLINQSFL